MLLFEGTGLVRDFMVGGAHSTSYPYVSYLSSRLYQCRLILPPVTLVVGLLDLLMGAVRKASLLAFDVWVRKVIDETATSGGWQSVPMLSCCYLPAIAVHNYRMYSSSNTKPCNLLLLVGLKGSGKTFTGGVLEKYLDVKFLRIEPIFLGLLQREPALAGIPLEQRGFQIVLEKLDELAQSHSTLCIESTGTPILFQNYYLFCIKAFVYSSFM